MRRAQWACPPALIVCVRCVTSFGPIGNSNGDSNRTGGNLLMGKCRTHMIGLRPKTKAPRVVEDLQVFLSREEVGWIRGGQVQWSRFLLPIDTPQGKNESVAGHW
jgi:hypothetical protein